MREKIWFYAKPSPKLDPVPIYRALDGTYYGFLSMPDSVFQDNNESGSENVAAKPTTHEKSRF